MKLKFGGLEFRPTFGTCTKTRIGLDLLQEAESYGKALGGKLHFLQIPQNASGWPPRHGTLQPARIIFGGFSHCKSTYVLSRYQVRTVHVLGTSIELEICIHSDFEALCGTYSYKFWIEDILGSPLSRGMPERRRVSTAHRPHWAQSAEIPAYAPEDLVALVQTIPGKISA